MTEPRNCSEINNKTDCDDDKKHSFKCQWSDEVKACLTKKPPTPPTPNPCSPCSKSKNNNILIIICAIFAIILLGILIKNVIKK